MSSLSIEEDRSSFEKLYMEYRGLMYSVAVNVLHDQHLAEDAVHNAFLKISNHVKKISSMDCHKTKAFMVIVVRNTSIDLYNRRKKTPLLFPGDTEPMTPGGEPVEDTVCDRIEIEELREKIGLLPEIYREVLILRCVHEFSGREISKILNINEATVRKRLERARERLLTISGKEAVCHA